MSNDFYVETSTICNFDCIFCGRPDYRYVGFMDNDKFEYIIDSMHKSGLRNLWLSPKCGEIFCDPGIYDKFEIIQKYKEIRVYMFTNYYSVDLKRLLKYHRIIENIFVSDYGDSDEEFEKLTRKPSSFRHKVLNNIKNSPIDVFPQERNEKYIKSQHLDNTKKGICYYGLKPGITIEGDFLPCYCKDPKCNYVVGNIKDMTVSDFINSDEYMGFLYYQMTDGSTFLKEPCVNCDGFTRGGIKIDLLKKINDWKNSKL